jgi:Ser/Thr protein kinase RdoA (MazF antagonist)
MEPALTNQCASVLRRYPKDYVPLHDDFQIVHGGFSGATIVRLPTRRGDYCLRGWPTASLPEPRIRGLHRLLEHVFHQGVTQVAVPVRSSQGDTLPHLAGRFWQLEPWMPGHADFHTSPTADRLRAAMHCLARWHAAARSFEPRADERHWFFRERAAPSPAVRERLDEIRRLLGGGTARLRALAETGSNAAPETHDSAGRILRHFDLVANVVANELESLRTIPFELHPCLRDVWHDHVLFTGNSVTGLIDPSASRSENVAADLARLLGSLVGDDRTAWQLALEAYSEIRPLGLEELRLVRALDRSGVLLSGMAWIARSYVQRQNLAVLQGAAERMQTLAERLETLAATT